MRNSWSWAARAAAATVATAFAVSACSSTPSDDSDAMKVGITLGVPGDLMTVVADEQGFFDERGVNVELMPPSLTTAQSAAVISNDLTIGTMVPATLWPAIDKGSCVRALGSTLGNTMDVILQPDIEVTGDPSDPDSTMQNLKGKTIGVTSRGSGMELWINALLLEAGMDPAQDVSFVAVGGPSTAVQAFKAKQVDALYYGPTMFEFLPESEVSRVTDIVGKDGNALTPLVQGFPSASCDTIEQRPDDILNYCKALWDAYEFSRAPANAEAMGTSLGRLIGSSTEAGMASWEALKDTFLPLTLTKDAWDAQAPLAASPEPTPPTYADSTYAPCVGGDPR